MTRTIRPTRAMRPFAAASPDRLRRRGARQGVGARKGITAMLAMLYLVVFSTMAVGFYSAVTMAVQISHNDERSMTAHTAAESGLQFVRYQLNQVRYPSNTPPEKILEEAYNDLYAQTLNSPNMDNHTVAMSGNRIYFPASSDDYYIPLDGSGAEFKAIMIDTGNRTLEETLPDGKIRRRTVRGMKVKVTGRHRGSKIARAIEMDFVGDYNSLNIFDFGVATRGPVNINGQGGVFGPNSLDGSVLTTTELATAVTMTGNATIAGHIYLTNEKGNVSLSNGSSVGGTTNSELKQSYVKRGVGVPDFPTVDSSAFLPFATNIYRPGQTVYRNTLIPARTNPNFSSDTVIEGVMYVKYPNQLSFTSKVTIRGVIVAENGATASKSNQVSFGGGIEAFGMDTLPDNSDFPASMKKLRGSVLLAPGFGVTLGGSSGTIGGTMVADSFTLSGGSGGVVHGNLIAVGPGGFNVTGGGSIQRTRTDEIPETVILPCTFKPLTNTYLEVHP